MDSKPQNRGWRTRSWKAAVVGLVMLAVYFGSFFVVRRGGSVTFIVGEPPHFYSVAVFYFSTNRPLNYTAWLFYYPLHRQSSDSLQRLEEALLAKDGDEEMARRRLWYFHVADINVLRRAGLYGFREEPTKPNPPLP